MQYLLPVGIDSPERQENLDLSVQYLLTLKKKIIISEVGPKPKAILKWMDNPSIQCMWSMSNGKQIQAQAVNQSLPLLRDDYVTIWDVDCFAPAEVLTLAESVDKPDLLIIGNECIGLRRSAYADILKMSHTGVWKNLTTHTIRTRYNYFGGIRVFKSNVLISIHGINPIFTHWGAEDDEIVIRLQKLGYTIGRINGTIYHLEHPTNYPSNIEEMTVENRYYLDRLADMTPEQMAIYALGSIKTPAPIFTDVKEKPPQDYVERFYQTARSAWNQ